MTNEHGTAARDVARRAFAVGSWLILVAILAQFLLAGLGIFAGGDYLAWHASFGAIAVGVLSLLLVLAGWIGRMPGRTVGLAASVIGLTAVQSLLLFPYHLNLQGAARAVSGLHVLNAVLIFWVGTRLVVRGRRLWTAPEAARDAEGAA
jgi:Family of unknown function (DUF6220)